jgi:hypothetical protein
MGNYPEASPSRSRPLALVLLATAILLASPAGAQVGQPPLAPEDVVNYAYVSGDTAFFNVVGQSVQAVRLPISYTLRSAAEHPWGVKLRFPVSIGFHDLSAANPAGGQLRENLATVSGLAGVEFQVPVGTRWTLKPFAEFGAGKDLDGGAAAWIYSGGLNTVLELNPERARYRIGLGAEYDGATLTGNGPSNGYTTLEAGLDVRFPVARAAAKRRMDWSVYGLRRHFPSALTFDQLNGERIELDHQNEIGFTVGFDRPFGFWLLKIRRVGIGYRFGERLSSVRILFSAPF